MHPSETPPSESATRHPDPTRRSLLLTCVASAALAACAGPSIAAGQAIGVDVIDRDSGELLDVYTHRGRSYIAGRPGSRYAIRITNRSGGRALAVVSVDGVNIVTGQTAAWSQTGYVFEPWQSYELTGWRKSDQQIAAFEFTSLPQSYAARTGRPQDVGVIGVAVFRERVRPRPQLPQLPQLRERESRDGMAERSDRPAPEPSTQAQAGAAQKSNAERQEFARDSRLGTGHGQREDSPVVHTSFERASTTPEEVVTLQYDRLENLVAAGIIPVQRVGRPRPFPGARDSAGYVPDPPTY